MTLQDAESAVMEAVNAAFEDLQIPFLRSLVETPSHTHAADDVEQAAQLVEDQVTGLGFSVARHPDPAGQFADHRVYSAPGLVSGAPATLLVGHVDTVFPRSMGFLEFARDEDGDTVRGPGVLDMKSGLSAIVFGLRALRQVVPDRFARLGVRFLCNTDEEVGSPSSAPLIETLSRVTTRALVFEGGRDEDRIITRRKGGGNYRLIATGRAAHAGNDHVSGRSAIHLLARLIPRIEAMTDYDRGITLNVGLMEGGTAKNTVPEHARCVIDARFLSIEDSEEVDRSLRALAAVPLAGDLSAPGALGEVKVRLEGGVTRPPMTASDASQELRREYEACAAAVGLKGGEAPLQGGGSDANLLSAHGVPSIDGLGPFGKFFHNPREWSSLDSLRRRTGAAALYLLRHG